MSPYAMMIQRRLHKTALATECNKVLSQSGNKLSRYSENVRGTACMSQLCHTYVTTTL